MTKNPSIDIAATIPCVPFGHIKTAAEYRNVSKVAERLGSLPVLAGHFNAAGLKLNERPGVHVGWGAFDPVYMPLPLLSFRLQVGGEMLYWLANSLDPEVWLMLDAWDAAGRMAVVAEFERNDFVVYRDFELAPPMRTIRSLALANMEHREKAVHEFKREAALFAMSGQLAMSATSDIPTISTLANVQVCTVETATTSRILVPHDVALASKCDLLTLPTADFQKHPGQKVH